MRAPLFRRGEGRIDKTLTEIQSAALLEVVGQGSEDLFEYSLLHPVLEAPVTGRLRAVAPGQVFPLGSGAQYPEHAIEQFAVVRPGAAAAVCPARRLWYERLKNRPLLISQIHRGAAYFRSNASYYNNNDLKCYTPFMG